jgi:hypothetical protein
MKVSDLRNAIKHLAGRTELLYFPSNLAEDENGKKLKEGLGYFDDENKELVYIGSITIVENED